MHNHSDAPQSPEENGEVISIDSLFTAKKGNLTREIGWDFEKYFDSSWVFSGKRMLFAYASVAAVAPFSYSARRRS